MNNSIWHDSAELPQYEALKADIKTDVLIIGGGICGLLCGYFLKQAGIDCVVVESNRIAGGTTGNTTAKITALHGLIYHELAEKSGFETAQKYYYANRDALREYEKLSQKTDFDFVKLPAYTFSRFNKETIQKEYAVLHRLDAKTELRYDSCLPFPVAASVGIPEQAQCNPIKLISFLCQDLKIYENTRVTSVTSNCAVCDGGKILAENIIFATHFPFIDRYGLYFLKLYQHRSYVLGLENAQKLDGMYVEDSKSGLSFRNYQNYLLMGGGGGRTGKPCGHWEELKRFREKYYPDSQIRFQWAAQDCMSLDKIPLIGQYSPKTPNWFVATGFNKWGMTSSMVAAKILSAAIGSKPYPYADIFTPSRSIWKPQLAVNCFETLSNFLYPTTKRCPHLGCALKWNKYEHSWDCSCHGSRFDEDGRIVNNPANKDLR